MKHKVWFAWGEYAAREAESYLAWEKGTERPATDNLNLSEYEFDTEAELNAFIKGVDEAVGWIDSYQIDAQESADKILKAIP